MRTLAGRIRALDAPRADALLALVFALDAAFELVVFVPGAPPRLGIVVACELALVAGLAVRRRWPLVAVVLAFAALGGIGAVSGVYTDHLVVTYFAVLFLTYSAGRHLDDHRVIVAGVAATAGQIVSMSVDDYADSIANVASSILFISWAPLLLGRFMRHRARLHATLREKASRLHRDRAARADEAAAEERARIAGELHDVVAHALSAMVVQAGAARRLADRDPARAGSAFAAVEGTGREALGEIRRLLGVLRRDDDELGLAPQPSLRHVGSLVGRVRAAGLPVELTVEGDERELPAGVDLTAYRVIQQALKAALEEGGAGRATVRVRFAADHVALRVTDDGALPGRALPGVPERVALYGGELRSAAPAEGGHVVRARLPVEATA